MGGKGVILGGKESSIVIISKRTILVISALAKSIDLNTNFKPLDRNRNLKKQRKKKKEKNATGRTSDNL